MSVAVCTVSVAVCPVSVAVCPVSVAVYLVSVGCPQEVGGGETEAAAVERGAPQCPAAVT